MTHQKRFLPAALLVATLCAAAAVMAAQIAFDVSSIRENTDPDAAQQLRRTPDGGLMTLHFPPRFLITIAYGIRSFQLVGMPGWSNNAYYDITAKPAAGSSATRDDMPMMLQALLGDRFQLRFHRENRAMDGYALVRVRRDALGPAMKPSAIDCDQTPAARPCRSATDAGSTFVASGASLWSLQQRLIAEVNAPIADDTGLTGTYDIDLRWSPDPTTNSEHPSLFTALQEQLGLKLERRRVIFDVLVVDRFERPSAN